MSTDDDEVTTTLTRAERRALAADRMAGALAEVDDDAAMSVEDRQKVDALAISRARDRAAAQILELEAEARRLDDSVTDGDQAEYRKALAKESEVWDRHESAGTTMTPEGQAECSKAWRHVETVGERIRSAQSAADRARAKIHVLEAEDDQTWFALVREEKDKILRSEASKTSRKRRAAREEVRFGK